MKVSECEGCKGCKLAELFPEQTYIPPDVGTGDRLLIGEAGGENENILGKPFVGGAGSVLDSMLSKAGIDRKTLTIINTLQCQPLKNIYPTSPEASSYISKEDGKRVVEHCYQHHVLPVLKSKKWIRIDLLGDKALEVITGKKGIYNWRGRLLEAKDLPGQRNVMATIHPAAILRDQVMFPVVISDLKKGFTQPPEHYNIFPSLDNVRDFNAKKIALDIETNRFTGEIYLCGLADIMKPYHAMVVPFKPAYKSELRRILLEAEEIVTHNGIQFDLPILCKALEIEYP